MRPCELMNKRVNPTPVILLSSTLVTLADDKLELARFGTSCVRPTGLYPLTSPDASYCRTPPGVVELCNPLRLGCAYGAEVG